MDELDKAITDLQRKIERWTRQAEEGRIELAALQKAAKLRPNGVRRPPDAETFFGPTSPDSGTSEDARRPGRKPGAISAEWRDVLEALWAVGGAHTYQEIHNYARTRGIEIKDIASTRDRVRGFAASGLMTGTAEAGFTVTELAADRFGFAKKGSAPVWDDFPDGADKAEGA